MADISHLPEDLRNAIEDYDSKVKSGELAFSDGKFADEPADTRDGWICSWATQHIGIMDSGG